MQGKQCCETERHRADEPDLECPQQVLPAGAQHQQEQRCRDRDHIARATPDELEQQHDVGRVQHQEHSHVWEIAAHADRCQQGRVDEPQQDRRMLVVRLEVRGPARVGGKDE